MLQERPAKPRGGPRTPGWKHGTPTGYVKGCRNDCPGGEDGRTCRQATVDHKRELRQERAQLARTATVESPGFPGISSGTIIAPSAAKLAAVLRPEPERTHRLAALAAELTALEEAPSAPTSPATKAPAPSPTSASGAEVAPTASTTTHKPEPDSPSTAPPADQSQPTAPPAPSASTAPSATAWSTTPQSGSRTLLADLALAFHTLHEETQRSPEITTPFDGLSGLMAQLLRAAWLDGHRSGVSL